MRHSLRQQLYAQIIAATEAFWIAEDDASIHGNVAAFCDEHADQQLLAAWWLAIQVIEAERAQRTKVLA
jgi:hypothetical protein